MTSSRFKKILLTLAFVGLFVASGPVLLPLATPQIAFADQTGVPPTPAAIKAAQNQPAAAGGEEQGDKIECGIANIPCFFGKLLYTLILLPAAAILMVSGVFLDGVIQITIIDFASWVRGVPGIRIAWEIFRDLLNLTFIFALLYAGIRMILGAGGSEKLIKGVIMAGLLINFSFFFTSVIIDVSNVFTVELHKAIVEIGKKEHYDIPGTGTDKDITGITAIFMQGLGLRFDVPEADKIEDFDQKHIQTMLFSALSFGIIAFVFFTMGILLLSRFVILLILLITSPIAVMGDALPQLSSQAKRWWNTLMSQAIFPPIMMTFMVVTVLIVSNKAFRDGFSKAEVADVSIPFGTGNIANLIQFAIVIGLLLAGIIVSKQTAGEASNGFTKWATGKAGSVAFGLGAWASRRTIGRAGSRIAESDSMRRLASSNNLFARNLGRGVIGAGNIVKTKSFDVRGVGGLGKTLGAGDAQKGGYEKWYKDMKKKREEQFKQYGAPTVETSRNLSTAQEAELRAKNAQAQASTAGQKVESQLAKERAEVAEIRRQRAEGVPINVSALAQKEADISKLEREQAEKKAATENAEKALKKASEGREIAESQAKIERAESQQRMARDKQAAIAGRGKSIWAGMMLNDADRAAAEELEKSAGKDKKAGEVSLAKAMLEQNEKRAAALEKLIATSGEDAKEAAKNAEETLKNIDAGIQNLIEKAKKEGVWDAEKVAIRRPAGFNPAVEQRATEMEAELLKLRDQQKKATTERDDNLKLADERQSTSRQQYQDELSTVKESISKAKGAKAEEAFKKAIEQSIKDNEIKGSAPKEDKAEPAEPKADAPTA